MSKKVVPFALPQPREAVTEAATSRDGDAWVLEQGPEPAASQGLVIDLEAARTPLQWLGLIWGFPYVAACAWTAQILRSCSGDRR